MAQTKGARLGAVTTSMWSPSATLFLLITSGIQEPEEPEEGRPEEPEEGRQFRSCLREREGGSQRGRGQAGGGSLSHWNPQDEANQ